MKWPVCIFIKENLIRNFIPMREANLKNLNAVSK